MSRRVIGRVERFDEIDSTNRYLVDAARAGGPSGLVAVARHQTAGRGRLGRRWQAPPGTNLLLSVLLRSSSSSPSEVTPHDLTLAVALAAADACAEVAGVEARLKWPNDLVVDDGKLAGVLAELVTGVSGDPAVVVGLGLNVGWPAAEPEVTVPAEPEGTVTAEPEVTVAAEPEGTVAAEPEPPGATSLAVLTGAPVDLDSLLSAVLEHADRRIAELLGPEGRSEQLEEYSTRCDTLGREVRIEEQGGSFSGKAVAVGDAGELVVETTSGPRTVTAADVVHLRHSGPA